MKNFFTFTSSLAMVLFLVGSALAIPTTWTETIDWENDIYFSSTSNNNWLDYDFSYFHNITNDGFLPGTDLVTEYLLEVALYDDSSDDRVEGATIIQLPLIEVPNLTDPDTNTSYNFSLEFIEIGWTVAGLLDINHDGTLNIWVEREKGDFYLDWSTITAYGDNGDCAPVPEPSTMLLLGLGLAGFAGYRRFKKTN
ncbi:MAG: PEP-CTERM sorting domain-containing protein [Deltaproteobacteria bacterium]|nr:PEP-CTERM sorting domain-containing protein [Deltaproteobacteria bacterium]